MVRGTRTGRHHARDAPCVAGRSEEAEKGGVRTVSLLSYLYRAVVGIIQTAQREIDPPSKDSDQTKAGYHQAERS